MIFRYLSKNFYISIIFVTLIFGLDRISKIYVISLSDKAIVSELFSSKFLNINLIWNEGIAFGLFSFDQDYLYNFLTLVILIVTLLVFIMTIKSKGLKKFTLLMIFGGAIGNLYDRIFFKAVPDFIDFHIGEFHWFVFNLADIFITIGVIFMILMELIDNNKDNNDKKI
ncbi:signal peptidase II [Candidatus Pelagibacter sp.]|nr:signal peptidase II [Candidatus Pelagibacter sp.]